MTAIMEQPSINPRYQQQIAAEELEPPINPAYEEEPDIDYGMDQASPNTPNSSDPENNSNNSNPHTKREIRGAAVVGGVAGLLIGGPLIGAVAAGGAALAVTNRGQAGKVARAGGEAVASMGDRLKKIDRKHKVVQKTGKGIEKGCKWISKKLKPRDAQ